MPRPLSVSPKGRTPATARETPARKPAGAVVGAVLVAGLALGGCEYTYDDGRSYAASAGAEATAAPGPLFTRDPLTRDPVGQDELDGWVARTLPEAPQPAVHLGAGVLAAGEVRSDASPALETGTYALTLACRSQRRVNFTVRSDTLTLVDLGLRCGINRENVIYLSAPTALTVTVEARTGANYAFRLRKL
ncbi:conserved hypothetical protein [Pseudarthrobacter chlorophenolicus A6]|uniref:Uncharacterized protein n=1 Tax=Pseudarthrobacter chlorophenolicus (strain ATCC 700700 / DSM 12829 / CIP 107037 / JCM 12360 / KCTC 9906 / NCIMB 13794 / A6) TaxID=452863 RepID=B8HFS0_PSECP|nr:hypothetical protein [Pseudarthrobacter chlorophenolicus]ACL41113.1 conserved hypothetical protein [Pseudarthrobacter chlorophenolicus A6]SDQ69739.1 hypothetical protein SAMN04489738_2329 [Pseudarthrobacter chlorophenolicus]